MKCNKYALTIFYLLLIQLLFAQIINNNDTLKFDTIIDNQKSNNVTAEVKVREKIIIDKLSLKLDSIVKKQVNEITLQLKKNNNLLDESKNLGDLLTKHIYPILTLLILIYGLHSWKYQLDGTNKMQIAKKIVGQIYLIRSLLKCARIPYIAEHELDGNSSHTDYNPININKNRTKQIKAAMANLEADFYLVYVEWGTEKHELFLALKRKCNEYFNNIDIYCNDSEDKHSPDYQKAFKIVFCSENQDKDDFIIELNKIVSNFESLLLPIIQSKMDRLKKRLSCRF